jgi:hypothetical protein
MQKLGRTSAEEKRGDSSSGIPEGGVTIPLIVTRMLKEWARGLHGARLPEGSTRSWITCLVPRF